jgi:hypothetical protein
MGSCFLGEGVNNGWDACGAMLVGFGRVGEVRAIAQSLVLQGIFGKFLHFFFNMWRQKMYYGGVRANEP